MGDSVVVQLPREALDRLPNVLASFVPQHSSRFIAALELAYLAASADGLDVAERVAIATTLENVTGIGFDEEAFVAHFSDLDEAVAMLGRRERLARSAAEFDSDLDRANAIRFAALVAMSDGELGGAELIVLAEACAYFEWPASRVHELVNDAAARVKEAS
jgi:hypothetical protein